MFECVILGDSIAEGVRMFRPECYYKTKTGINSKQFNVQYKENFSGTTAIISLGTNDLGKLNTASELLKLRKRITADKVYWILPANDLEKIDTIEKIANFYGDWMIKIPYLSNDGIHPNTRGYKKIAEITKSSNVP